MLHACRRLLVALSILFALCGAAEAQTTRVYVLHGQVYHPGVASIASQVAKIDKRIVVTTHRWATTVVNTVAADIRRLPADTRIVLVGYSLGAGAATWIAAGMPQRKIELVVAYDPSVWQTFPAVSPNVDRALLYHNRCAPIWGRAVILGPQVETTEVCSLHLRVPSNQQLLARTIAAVKKVHRRK